MFGLRILLFKGSLSAANRLVASDLADGLLQMQSLSLKELGPLSVLRCTLLLCS